MVKGDMTHLAISQVQSEYLRGHSTRTPLPAFVNLGHGLRCRDHRRKLSRHPHSTPRKLQDNRVQIPPQDPCPLHLPLPTHVPCHHHLQKRGVRRPRHLPGSGQVRVTATPHYGPDSPTTTYVPRGIVEFGASLFRSFARTARVKCCHGLSTALLENRSTYRDHRVQVTAGVQQSYHGCGVE